MKKFLILAVIWSFVFPMMASTVNKGLAGIRQSQSSDFQSLVGGNVSKDSSDSSNWVEHHRLGIATVRDAYSNNIGKQANLNTSN